MARYHRLWIDQIGAQEEEVTNGVVHPATKETITTYKQLITDPLLR